MSALAQQFLSWLLLYGYPIAGALVFVGALGLPLPTTVLLVAAGAFAAEGEFSLGPLLVLVTVCAVLGDVTCYWAGRWVGEHALAQHGPRWGLTAERLSHACQRLQRWGGWAVFLTRCLVTLLALPVSLLAGASKYSALRYLAFALTGETVWTSSYVLAGYTFGANWQAIEPILGDASAFLAAVVVTVALGFLASRLLRPEATTAAR